MKVLVLGSAAGGGFPQWNCNCSNSSEARKNPKRAKPRTQSSIAVSVDNGKNWFLFNASPDLRQQINDNSSLHPKTGIRHSPILGVFITNGDIDHIAGLLNLRESHPLSIYATKKVLGILNSNTVFNVLNPDFVERREVLLNKTTLLEDKDNNSIGIEVEVFPVPGKVALFLEDKNKGNNFGTDEEDTIGLKIIDAKTKKYFFYIPGCAGMTDHLKKRVKEAPMVLFDGTLWTDDEMLKAKVGVQKTGQRMGHMSMSGEKGTIEIFKNLDIKKKIFIHINTTNPALLEDSAERTKINEEGWEVSYDGMEVNL
jgi:pyrroloquinoline quinone biosynthesis protein B